MSNLTNRLLFKIMDESEALKSIEKYALFGICDHADGDKIFIRLWLSGDGPKFYEEYPLSALSEDEQVNELSAAISERVSHLLMEAQ